MAAADTIRAFLAVEIPDELKRVLVTESERLRGELPATRWTSTAGWHLTLKFLGEIEPPRLVHLAGDLEDRVRSTPEIAVRLHGSGFFPSNSNPRVAWVGGSAPGIEAVKQAVEESAEAAGFEPDRRSWSIHLTLARIKKRWPKAAVERWLAWGNELDLPPFTCTEVVLFQSDLRPDGAVYTALERIPFE